MPDEAFASLERLAVIRCILAFAVLLLLGGGGLVHADPAPSPVGIWRTFDHEDHSETGAIEIVEQGGVLSGRLVRILNPAHANDICTGCKDDRKNTPMLGLQLIRNVKPAGDRWLGEILDPHNGRIYKVELHLQNGGQKLLVRGFVGVTLLGRTETWLRE
jgi:uncharacterized protein (DUF2147 family)